MVSLDVLRQHLRVEHEDEDNLIARYEEAAVSAIESWTGRYFGPTAEVTEEVYSGGGSDLIWLSEIPDLTIAGSDPVIQVETWNGVDWDLVASTDFETDGFALYHKASYWPTGRRNVRVTYTRGYAPGEEPWGIRQAVMMLVAHWYQNRESIVVGTIVTEVPDAVRALIAPYRKVRI